MHVRTFNDRQDLAQALKDALVQDLTGPGPKSLALSGGSTPLPLLKALRDAPLDWSTVHLTLVDERWVDPDHEQSNEAMIRTYLGDHLPIHFMPLKTSHTCPEDAVESFYSTWQKMPPLCAVVLGMGTDGHFASLFPKEHHLAAGLDLNNPHAFIATHPPTSPYARISMTLKTILSAKAIYLHITGADKLEVLNQATHHRDPMIHPIAALLDYDIKVFYAP